MKRTGDLPQLTLSRRSCAHERRRFSYRSIGHQIRAERTAINDKRVYRLYRLAAANSDRIGLFVSEAVDHERTWLCIGHHSSGQRLAASAARYGFDPATDPLPRRARRSRASCA